MMSIEEMKTVLEMSTGGSNTILVDEKGLPSVMVRIPMFYLDNVLDGAPHEVHPAFLVNGKVKDAIYISKYENRLIDGLPYSLPDCDPETGIRYPDALSCCYKKGRGWHLMSNAEWAAIALWCRKNGTIPRGNNYFGGDYKARWERGVVCYPDEEHGTQGRPEDGRTAAGSGPAAWNHNHQESGICDLNGNVWEWLSGFRVRDGEIQLMPDNNAAMPFMDHSAESTEWRAIREDGSLTLPGSARTLHYDTVNADGTGSLLVDTKTSSRGTNETFGNCRFDELFCAEGVNVPVLMKALALYPDDCAGGGDGIWVKTKGIRYAFRGGAWYHTEQAGIFSLSIYCDHTYGAHHIGFRSAYCEL